MVKINRPDKPKDIVIMTEDHYRSEPVHGILKKAFYGKCYICECDNIRPINVEHRVSVKSDPTQQFDWHNLFYSCGCCNNTKKHLYNNVIDCTVHDPEKYISLSLEKPNARCKVTITKTENATESDVDCSDTITLLNIVYNGMSTSHRTSEGKNLRQILTNEILSFYCDLDSYEKEQDIEVKDFYKKRIISRIVRSSCFAAFKRKILRDFFLSDEYEEFRSHLDG